MRLHEAKQNKTLLINVALSFGVKGCAVIVGVLTVPAYMAYFDQDVILGLWYTLLSVLSWVLNFDLGIGNGLRNLLVKTFASKDKKEAKTLVSSAYVSIGCVSVLFALFGTIAIHMVDLNGFLGIERTAVSPHVLRKAFEIAWLGITSQLLFKLIVSILNAHEKTALSSALPLISNIIILCFVAINKGTSDEQKLLQLSWTYMIAVIIPYLVATIVAFTKTYKAYRPSLTFFDRKISRSILSLGGAFFFIQIALMIINVTNEIIITRLYGAEKVVEYQVYNKVFYTIVTLFSLITNPVWSAVATAYCDGNMTWIRKVYRLLLVTVGLCSVGILLVSAFFQTIVNIWLKAQAIRVEFRICVSFLIYSVVLMFCYAESSIANGMSKLKVQLRCYVLAACLKFPLCFLAYKLFNQWNTVVLVNGISLIPYIILQHFAIQKLLKK